MTFQNFCNLDPESKYQAYVQLKASLHRYHSCLFWSEVDLDLLPGASENLARQIMYYFASGQQVTALHPVCQHLECINPLHCYPIDQVAIRKACWEHLRKSTQIRAACQVWCGGKISGVPTHHESILRLSVAQVAYELHYGVKFFAAGLFRATCRIPGCINPQHLQPLNPAFVYHWQTHTKAALAEALLNYVRRIPCDEQTGCRFWTGGLNNGRSPVIKVGTKRYGVSRLLYNYAYGLPLHAQKVTMSCGHSNCVEPTHMDAYGLHYTDPCLEVQELDKKNVDISVLV